MYAPSCVYFIKIIIRPILVATNIVINWMNELNLYLCGFWWERQRFQCLLQQGAMLSLCPLAQGWIRLTWHKNLWHFSHFCKEARPRALLRCTKFRSRSAESANVDSGNLLQQLYFWIKYSFGWNDWPRCCCFVLCSWHGRELQIWGVHLRSWEKI